MRRMRLELTRPCDHYPLKVACIPISPPAQGLFEKLSGKRDSNPRPQPWQGCALPTELFPHLLRKREIFALLNNSSELDCFRLSQKFRREFISHLRMQSYCFFLIWPNIFENIFICFSNIIDYQYVYLRRILSI